MKKEAETNIDDINIKEKAEFDYKALLEKYNQRSTENFEQHYKKNYQKKERKNCSFYAQIGSPKKTLIKRWVFFYFVYYTYYFPQL